MNEGYVSEHWNGLCCDELQYHCGIRATWLIHQTTTH